MVSKLIYRCDKCNIDLYSTQLQMTCVQCGNVLIGTIFDDYDDCEDDAQGEPGQKSKHHMSSNEYAESLKHFKLASINWS